MIHCNFVGKFEQSLDTMKNKITSLVFSVALMTASTSCSLFNNVGSGVCGCNATCQCRIQGLCGPNGTHVAPTTGVHQPVAQRDSVSKAYLQELLNTDYSLVQYMPETPKPMVWLDDSITLTADELLPLLNAKSTAGMTRYQPRNVQVATDNNDVFFHFSTDANGNPEPLHLRVQYYADDPLYYEDMIFTVDGFDYTFHANAPQRGKLKGNMYWENSDDVLTEANKDLVYALANSKYWVTLKLEGRGGMNHLKTLTKEQIKDFYNVLTLYRLKGGKF